MSFKALALIGSLVICNSAQAATWVRYTALGGGDLSESTYNYRTQSYTGYRKPGTVTLSFSVDLDEHVGLDYSSDGASFTTFNEIFAPVTGATGTAKTLMFGAGERTKVSSYEIQLRAIIDGESPNDGFARSIARAGASGTITYHDSYGNQAYDQRLDFAGRINRVEVVSANRYEDFSISTNAVPEPATWAMMISGFGLVGGIMRRRAITPIFGERKRRPV